MRSTVAKPVVPPDEDARRRIATALDDTLFVEAGAGSGKTSSLVQRVVSLVIDGGVELRSIAAITFTDKAGAELRDRARRSLEERAASATSPEVRARCLLALDQLDGAAIGTLHAFAQRILSESPIEAGLPPRVEVLDEVSSGVEFERRWSEFRDGMLAEPALERTILLLTAAGVKHTAMRVLALAFDQSWDLVAERVPDDAPDPPAVRALVSRALDEVTALCRRFHEECLDKSDRLFGYVPDLERFVATLRTFDGDECDLLEALDPEGVLDWPKLKPGNAGKKGSYRCDVGELRAALRCAADPLDNVRNEIAEACAKRIATAVKGFTLDAAAERRSTGRLLFHDLLVLARGLVRDAEHGASVRARLHERYQRLLLDEFQDTDPIQIELAVRIAASDPESDDAGTLPWNEVDIAPGRLFVVGDPKQSIYRFRRADIATFLSAQARFGEADDALVRLTANFRTGDAVIGWVNRVFGELIQRTDDPEMPPSQPEYVALSAVRADASVGPPVSVIGRVAEPPRTRADDLRAVEAEEVAATIGAIVRDGWHVADRDGTWRPARLGDITVLVPARTSLPFLEDSLEIAGIAYRAESSSLVYATRAVRDLLITLRAVDDPTDHLMIVSALRSPLFGCGDDDLFRFKVERKGHWGYTADQPPTVPPDDPVAAGLSFLAGMHELRQWHSPGAVLDRIAAERRALELGFGEGRPRDVWRRLRFVVDQARAWSDAVGGSLRDYLGWVDQQTAEGARVAEAVLPETDDDAVRIMTIHAAKGLEFPITIVSGMSTRPQRIPAPADVVFPHAGGVGYKFGRHVSTEEYEAYKPIDEQMGFDERVRLLYVACTRAKDHLVVSLTRAERNEPEQITSCTNAELLLRGIGAQLDELPDAAPAGGDLPVSPTDAVDLAAIEAFDQWDRQRAAALAAAAVPLAVAATSLTDEGGHDVADEHDATAGLQKRPRDLDLPPWLKGRYGTAVGRAVHGALQTVDLATGADLDGIVRAQCEAEAVGERADVVRGLVDAALGSPAVAAAATLPHWREVYACTPVGAEGRLLEGYVDLLYRTGDGLVVVDYKTAATSDPAELARRVDGYRLQGASYALAVAAATGEPVIRVVFLFLTPNGTVEIELDGLDAAIARVRDLIAAGGEVIVEERVSS